MAESRVVVEVRGVPEVLAEMRLELASLLRARAGGEPNPTTAVALREVAAMFEAGVGRRDASLGKEKKR